MSDLRCGYAGRTLKVDLSTGTTETAETPDPTRWLGSRGWNALIGWEHVLPGIGPYDPENHLAFSAGTLAGTGAPTAGRVTVSSLSPRGYPTPMWTSATMGGYLATELKLAGFDCIDIHGQANTPCYLLIENDAVSVRDARELWGLGVYQTQRRLKEAHGADCQIAAIGPAGENRVRFATIHHRLSNAIGNGGLGGVMGSKNLKAIVVRGTGRVRIAHPQRMREAIQFVNQRISTGLYYTGRPEPGPDVRACSFGCTARCHTRLRRSPDRYGLGVPWLMTSCVDGVWMRGEPAPGAMLYQGRDVHGQELAIRSTRGFPEEGADLTNLTNDLGITNWVHHTWSHYLGALRDMGITEIAGQPLDIDDPDWWRRWLEDIAYRRGLGDDYAEGLSRFHDKHQPGPRYLADFFEDAGSRGHGWHREGRTMERHPSPFWEHSALLYAVSTRDVTPSTHGFFFLNPLYGYPEAPLTPEDVPARLKQIARVLYGSEEAAYPGTACLETVTMYHQHCAILKDSMGVCDWKYPVVALPPEDGSPVPDETIGNVNAEWLLLEAATGLEMDPDALRRPAAERVLNLERCIEIRNNGRSRPLDEAVIPHYQWSDKTDGTHLSADADEFRDLLDRYYALSGWDSTLGWPSDAKLRELGLDSAAETIAQLRQSASV